MVAAQAGDHVLNAVLAVGYGITLAEWLKLTKLSGTPSYLLGGCFATGGSRLALGAADLDVLDRPTWFFSWLWLAFGLPSRRFVTTHATSVSE